MQWSAHQAICLAIVGSIPTSSTIHEAQHLECRLGPPLAGDEDTCRRRVRTTEHALGGTVDGTMVSGLAARPGIFSKRLAFDSRSPWRGGHDADQLRHAPPVRWPDGREDRSCSANSTWGVFSTSPARGRPTPFPAVRVRRHESERDGTSLNETDTGSNETRERGLSCESCRNCSIG